MNTERWVPAKALVACRNCRAKNLAWVQSARTQRWYLVTGREMDDGSFQADARGLHDCPKRQGAKDAR